MSVYSFLASLPAVLGVLGFVVYLFIDKSRKPNPVILQIVEKLRSKEIGDQSIPPGVKPKQLSELIKKNHSLRLKVSNQDFALLEKVLSQQFYESVFVYAVCAVMFFVGTGFFIYQSTLPEPLALDRIQLSSDTELAEGVAVDLDPLKVRWSSTGQPRDLQLYLENMDTNVRTEFFSVGSGTHEFKIFRDQYRDLLAERRFGRYNRVKVFLQSDDDLFTSREVQLHVGLEIVALPDDNSVRVAAMIDNALVDNYLFDAQLAVWKKDALETLSLDQNTIRGMVDYPVDDVESYNWLDAKLVYLGPDDSRFIRTRIIY